MIELRLIKRVPEQAASVAYVYSKPLSVKENVSLVDYSRERSANSLEYYKTKSTIDFGNKNGSTNIYLYADEIVLGNRSVLSQGVSEGAPLFYRYYVGGWASMLLVADSTSVSVGISSTTILLTNGSNTFTYVYTNKTTREIAKEINAVTGNGVFAHVLTPTAAAFETGSFSATTSGLTLYNISYHRVYNTDASTSDLETARETIKKTIEILVDQEKTNEVQWDLVVDAYETNGFLCSLYLDRKAEQGKTYQIRFPAVSTAGTVQNNRVEVINSLPYLVENVDYTLTQTSAYWTITDVEDSSAAMAFGVFGSGSITLTGTQISIGATNYTYTGKNLRRIVADLNSNFTDHRFTLLNEKASLDSNGFTPGTFTIEPSGTAIRFNRELNIISGPDTRIHPLLPYDEESHRPWYPRIQYGCFNEVHWDDVLAYQPELSGTYTGFTKLNHRYSVPEFSDQTFKQTLGEPYRSMMAETPIIVADRILRTRRFPLESLGSITLREGELDITSHIVDIDIEQGFIFLNTSINELKDLTIDYVYEERSLVYTGINLNTAYNSDVVGKFVGVYVVPSNVSYIWSTATAVQHVIRDDAKSILDDLAALQFVNGVYVHPMLVGIYQVLPTEDKTDVKFIEAAPGGGGINEGVELVGEAAFVTDEGRWDGEPFDGDQSIILEVPSSVMVDGNTPTPPFRINPAKLTGFMSPDAQFTKEDIIKAANKWVPPGTLILVESSDA